MNNYLKSILCCVPIVAATTNAVADDFGVALEWTTQDFLKIVETMPRQRAEFSKLIENGEIKDMFLLDSEIDGKPMKILRFVIEAEDEAQVETKLRELPLYKENMVKISGIKNLGTKWLDNTPIYNNYSLTLTWHKNVSRLEMDRVLAIDLQKIIALNQTGFITSSYLHTQQISDKIVQPMYTAAMLAKDAQHAHELGSQFEAVRLGYATVSVRYLGHKLDMDNLQ